jgi:thymidylate synthase
MIQHVDYQYQDLINHVFTEGEHTKDRTGTGTISLLSEKNVVVDLRMGFPLLTTKRVPLRLIFEELKWFFSGSTNSKSLEDKKVMIWAEWGTPEREHGPIYGKQWRDWCTMEGPFSSDWVRAMYPKKAIDEMIFNPFGHKVYINPYTWLTVEDIDGDQLLYKHIDQLKMAEHLIVNSPESRRNVSTFWRVDQLEHMSLTPCHGTVIQWKPSGCGKYLDLKTYQRSCDLGLGVPFNIASYALLLELMARKTGKIARKLVYEFGDLHIYTNHVEQLKEQAVRKPTGNSVLRIKLDAMPADLKDINFEDIELLNYNPHPNTFVHGPMGVSA